MPDDRKYVNLTLSQSLYERIKEQADARGVSIPGFIRYCVNVYLSVLDKTNVRKM